MYSFELYWTFAYHNSYNYCFCFLLGIPIVITSSAIGVNIGVTTAGIKNKKHDKIVLLAKSKLNSIEVLISKALTIQLLVMMNFFLINNVLKGYNEMKKRNKKI